MTAVSTVSDELVEKACEVMHDAYERAAVIHAWETNPASRHQEWADVPEANKATMRDAVRALLNWLPVIELVEETDRKYVFNGDEADEVWTDRP